ncbi:hypothetical protein [Streptomyces sp. NPDC008092]|uniref:hypothetical protein n=1 Tax=Streptomyces sp. NPDC008092 TaxID=3364808 RepID=UPI0036E78174
MRTDPKADPRQGIVGLPWASQVLVRSDRSGEEVRMFKIEVQQLITNDPDRARTSLPISGR